MAAQKVLCFDHVTNWSGGEERAGPRNNGNQLATAVEFWEKQNGGQKCTLDVVNCTLRFRLQISFQMEISEIIMETFTLGTASGLNMTHNTSFCAERA